MSCVLEPRIGMVRKSLALGDVFQQLLGARTLMLTLD